MGRDDKLLYHNLLKSLCDGLDKIIEDNTFQDVEYKKNVTTISSFLEFLKAGASVTSEFVGDKKINFTIEMK